MLYLFLKSFHLAAVLAWVGGMLTLSVLLGALDKDAPARGPHEQGLLAASYRWDRRATTLGLVWVLGIALALMSGWYNAPWLWLKVAIVFVLSGLLGNQFATMQRLVSGAAPQQPARVRRTARAVIVAITAIALLVIFKPWGAV
jgi:uncharacterized membrane protein